MEMEMEDAKWARIAWEGLCRVRERCPVIQCITNYVSMDIMANTLLAAGASPAMVHAQEEIPEFTARHAAGLCINIGTLTPSWIHSMKAAAAAIINDNQDDNGNQCQFQFRGWVLDPVAVGASSFRLAACLELLQVKPSVIRGNASEILALGQASIASCTSKGVDSSHQSDDALDVAKDLALRTQAIVAISGAIDYVTDGTRVLKVFNGVPLMQKITATGCAVTALISAFLAAMDKSSSALEATAFALSVFGLAGEIGMEKAKGPASLRMHLIDSLYSLDKESVLSKSRISEM